MGPGSRSGERPFTFAGQRRSILGRSAFFGELRLMDGYERVTGQIKYVYSTVKMRRKAGYGDVGNNKGEFQQ